MKFFKPEDFTHIRGFSPSVALELSRIANDKLQWARVKVRLTQNSGNTVTIEGDLINIEPIEEKCQHPRERCKIDIDRYTYQFKCECGAKVKPKEFEVCE